MLAAAVTAWRVPAIARYRVGTETGGEDPAAAAEGSPEGDVRGVTERARLPDPARQGTRSG